MHTSWLAAAGTFDLGMDLGEGKRRKSVLHDWMPLLRDGDLVLQD